MEMQRSVCPEEQFDRPGTDILLVFFVLFVAIIHTAGGQDIVRDTVYAQPPVVVTATKAIGRLSPITFSDLSRSEILQRNSVQDIPVLLSELPSITTYSENGSGIGYNYINLRGFDQRRISVMINGVPQNDPEDHNVYWVDFPDLLAATQEIQVQRGAGSAFYGPAAIGGSVNLVANPFTATPAVAVETALGFQEFGGEGRTSLATRKLGLSLNSGLIDRKYMLFARMSRIQHDGYREQGWVDMRSYFLAAARFDETMTTRIHVYGGPISDGLAYVGLPKSYNQDLRLRRTNYSYWEYDSTGVSVGYAVPQKRNAQEEFSQPHAELLHEWRLSESVRLHTTAFAVFGDGHFDYDGDWVPYDGAASEWFRRNVGYDSTFGVTTFPTFLIRGAVSNRQWGLLPRIELDHGTGTLTAGAEVRIHRSHHSGQLPSASVLPGPGWTTSSNIYDYRGVRDIVSLYLHEVYRLRDDVSLLGDLQLAHQRYGIRDEAFVGHRFDVRYTFLNPRVGVNWNLSEAFHTYAFAGFTTREPRMRNLYAAEDAYFGATPEFAVDIAGGVARYDFSRPLAKPEQLLNVEWGWGWTADGARVNANLFWMEFTNELIKSGQVDVFGQPRTGNADRTRHLGIELDGIVRLNGRFALSGNLTWSQNRLVRYRVADGAGWTVLDGNPIAGFPDLLGNLRLEYAGERTRAGLSAKHVGAFYTDNYRQDRNRNDAFTVLNGDATHELTIGGGLGLLLRLEVRNILNTLYTSGGEGEAFFPAAERNWLVGVTVRY
jgi:iron complex outermembrane receptor protein